MTTREEFLAERKLGIGGSDVSSLFNEGYGCRRRLWYDKTNAIPDFPREETDAMSLGKFLESWFADKYRRTTGRPVYSYDKPFVHPQHPELRDNLDRSVAHEDGRLGAQEIKAMGRAMFYKTKREGLPIDYALQLQQGMLVPHRVDGSAMFDWGCFAIGCRDDGAIMHWDVQRDEKIHKEIILAGQDFWRCVENGPIPDALEPDDRRCQSCEFRVTCQGNNLIELAPEGELVPAPELLPLVAQKIERDALYDEAVELCEETDEELKTRLGDRQAVIVGDRSLYHRPQKGKTLYKGKELLEAYRLAWSEIRNAVDNQGLVKFTVNLPPPDSFLSESKPSRPLRLMPPKGGK